MSFKKKVFGRFRILERFRRQTVCFIVAQHQPSFCVGKEEVNHTLNQQFFPRKLFFPLRVGRKRSGRQKNIEAGLTVDLPCMCEVQIKVAFKKSGKLIQAHGLPNVRRQKTLFDQSAKFGLHALLFGVFKVAELKKFMRGRAFFCGVRFFFRLKDRLLLKSVEQRLHIRIQQILRPRCGSAVSDVQYFGRKS